jgi:DNA polymerase III sliding clamp (beta) subunit (PCNA family)
MTFHIKRKDLLEQVRRVAKVASPGSTIAELRAILVEARADTGLLRLTATNLESSARVTLRGVVKRAGETLINAKMLLDVLSKLPGDEVYFNLRENNTLAITSEASSFELAVQRAKDFPRVELPTPGETVTVSGLRSLIEATAFAATQESAGSATRPIYCCVRLELSDAGIRAAATNDYCVTETQGDADAVGDFTMLIPVQTLKTLASLSSDADVYELGVTGADSGKYASFFDGTLLFSTRLMAGDYVDVDKLFTSFESAITVTTDAAALRNAIANVTAIHDKSSQLELSFADGALVLRCATSEGTAAMSVPTTGAPETDRAYYFAPRHLLDCVKAMSGSVTLELGMNGMLLLRHGKTRYLQVPVRKRAIAEAKPETAKKKKKAA